MNLPLLDGSLFYLINKGMQNGFFDFIMPIVTKNAELVFLGLVLWATLKEKNTWRILLIALFAVALADGSGHLLKDIFARQRPCSTLSDINLLVGCGKAYSLPSNHASNAFAFAVTFFIFRRDIIGYFFLLAAGLIGFSRIYVGVHYPFDILIGAIVGIIASITAIRIYRWGSEIHRKRSYGEALGLSLILISIFRIYFILTGPFDLSPDEAHYWEWSRRIDWSYYSKGPMIAYLIYIGTHLFGDTVLGVRVFAVVLSAGSSFLIYRIGKERYDDKTGFVAALLIQIVPLYSVYGLVFTIDSPFIFFWILSLYLFHRILQQSGGTEGRFDFYWLLLGASVGLGLLTKYTMAFFLVSAFLFLLSSEKNRRILMTSGPYGAALMSLAVFSPVVFWNAANGWVTFKHTAGQAHIADGLKLSAMTFIEFIGSQIGVVTPLLFFFIILALWRLRKTEHGSFFFWFSVPVLVFFAVKSLQGKVQANWALPGYAAGFLAFAAFYAGKIRMSVKRSNPVLMTGLFLAMLVTYFAHFPSVLNLPRSKDPTSRLVGWKELGIEASRAYLEMNGTEPVFIFSDKYQVASELAFYMEGNPVTYCINLGRRMNQYDLWPDFKGLTGHNALFVRTSDAGLPPDVENAFERCEKDLVSVKTKKKIIMKFTFFKCYDFKDINIKQADKY
jgi:4-amino-4-deoxy-L-arabinose transferase-like glycosyltransferase